MKQNKLLLTLYTLLIYIGSASSVTAQTATCRDTAEHHRLLQATWNKTSWDCRDSFYTATARYQRHTEAENDMESYYNAWVNKIVYELDRMDIYRAYQALQGMKHDMEKLHPVKDEQFLVPNMLGQIYNTCGYTTGAIEEFKKAVELIQGTHYEDGLGTLYLGMAHIYMGKNPDESMHWIEKDIEAVNRMKSHPRHFRNLSNAYAFKAILDFRTHRMDDFQEDCRRSKLLEQQNQSGSHGSFLPYRDAYEAAFLGYTEVALRKADSLSNHKDRYLVKSDIYHYAGNDVMAMRAMRQLMHQRDSIAGVMIADNIQKTEEEIELANAEREASRTMTVALTIAIVLALLLIAALVANTLNRRRYQKRLLEKNHELRAANEKALESDHMKSAFIRNVSHEIRTPLNIINGFSQLLTDGNMTFDEYERRNMSDTIIQNTHAITSLVNNMLAIATEDATEISKNMTATPCISYCKLALRNMPKTAEGVSVQLDTQVAADATVNTNGECLLHCLHCLLENAAKFTEQGTISLICRRQADTMQFIVEDTGCGISAESAPHIFERFTKGNEFKQGLGLGLAYCHETAEKLGGSLTLDCSYTQGARFVLSLPA